jgi:hypothetical protein
MPFAPVENLFKGIFGEKVTEAEKAHLVPKEGDKIFNTTLGKCQVFKDGEWVDR